jgi:type II secretory pathway pseudopilin PulG
MTLSMRKRSVDTRGGFSLVDCLILLLILGLALGAITSTLFWASDLGNFNRATLGMRTVTSSLFEALESIPPATLDSDFNAAFANLIASLGGSGGRLGGYTITATAEPAVNGAREVTMTISQEASKKGKYTLKRSVNSFSENTADDVVDS